MYPSLRNQPQGAGRGHIVAEVHLDIVVAGKPLVLSPTEGIQIVAVEVGDDRGYVGALVVGCFLDVAWRRDGGDGELRGGDYEPLVGEDFGADRMVDDHQFQVVVV